MVWLISRSSSERGWAPPAERSRFCGGRVTSSPRHSRARSAAVSGGGSGSSASPSPAAGGGAAGRAGAGGGERRRQRIVGLAVARGGGGRRGLAGGGRSARPATLLGVRNAGVAGHQDDRGAVGGRGVGARRPRRTQHEIHCTGPECDADD